ncbi:TetR/AcrR family transcriptional regulator [Nevskia sp.]|uniref:TetR/AcrR family transcriptional regulator n=1 Tax=Nevskia sp. TaxID=1929292 RepID=UPI0025FCD9B0|nr:TetR/AcrR family transcriptional regulator [Nevskia sp.]
MALKQGDATTAASATAAGVGAIVSKRRGYAGRTAEQLAAERRQRLLDAALSLFSERGFSRTPIELLCSAAKVTTRHFYEHFDSREAVLIALYEQINLETRATVMKALQVRGKTIEELMFAAIDAFIESCTVDTRRTRILCVEVIGVSSDMFERRRHSVHEFATILNMFTQQLVDAGGLPPGDYWHSSMALIGAIRELMIEWLMAKERPPIDTVHGQIKGLFRCLIAGAGALNREAAKLKA